MRGEDRKNICHPFVVIGMPETIDMGVNMGVVPMSNLGSGSMGVLYRVVFCLKRVWQDSDLLIPYFCEDLIMSPELINADDPAPDFAALRMMDQHAVTEKFPADCGSCRVYGTCKSLAFGVLPAECAAFLRCRELSAILLKIFFNLISKLRLHVYREEFIRYTISAEIIPPGNLPLNPDELSKTEQHFPHQLQSNFAIPIIDIIRNRFKNSDLILNAPLENLPLWLLLCNYRPEK